MNQAHHWSVGIEPDDFDRFLDEDAATYLAIGFTLFTLGFNGPDWRVEHGLADARLARRDEPLADSGRVAGSDRRSSRRSGCFAHAFADVLARHTPDRSASTQIE